MDDRRVHWMKIVLLVSSLTSLALLGAVAYRENFGGEWRGLQRRYQKLLVATADNEHARQAASSFEVGLSQLYLVNLDRVDRCTSCHLGVDNPGMADADPPLRRHSGNTLRQHPVERFGCTICHEGVGRAVTREKAHGWDEAGHAVPHIETPLLRGDAIYTSCGKCHHETDLFGGLQDLFVAAAGAEGAEREKLPLDEDLLRGSLPGADFIARGKELLIDSGCLGCHKYRGRGGTLGPDITYAGEKTRHDYDFSHVRGEHTVEQWLFEHFMLPAEISPGTSMPNMGFTGEEARALALTMRSLRRKTAPASHRPHPTIVRKREIEPVRGATLYAMFCSACHGEDGLGTTMRAGLWPANADPWGHDWDADDIVVETRGELEVLVPSLNHPDAQAVASDTFYRRIIERGRPGTAMPAWAEEGGLTADEITLLVDHLRSWREPPPASEAVAMSRGDARVGGALYRANCATCHGVDGEGGIGVSLASPTFLAVASDGFLRDTIVGGRPDTAMPAWPGFSAQEVSDLIAFLRQWQPARGSVEGAHALVKDPPPGEVSAEVGAVLYKANCVMCHGPEGKGDLGPSLSTPEFLEVVSDRYLLTTLIEGRPGTGMPSWRHLADRDLASIVLHVRGWQGAASRPGVWHGEQVVRGDAEMGEILFGRICSGCHGPEAEGATGPQLSNPVFLRTATDRMLEFWIRQGKTGTAMRGFRRGGQGIAELSDRQISDIVAYVRSLEERREGDIRRVAKSPHGRPEKGRQLYAGNCAGCHGDHGEGASGPALSNPGFLQVAPDGFILATLALGRQGTEMRPAKRGPQSILGLSSDEVNDIVAYLRSWEHDPPLDRSSLPVVPHRFVVPWDLARGRRLYDSACSGCHGIEGKGSWAPELNNEGFLAAATDGFLQATIVRGRRGTAMRAFGPTGQGLADLDADQIDDIVAYVRSWSKQTPSPMTIPAERSIPGGDGAPEPSGVRSAMGESRPRPRSKVAAGDGDAMASTGARSQGD